jgi:hypothetical protein
MSHEPLTCPCGSAHFLQAVTLNANLVHVKGADGALAVQRQGVSPWATQRYTCVSCGAVLEVVDESELATVPKVAAPPAPAESTSRKRSARR